MFSMITTPYKNVRLPPLEDSSPLGSYRILLERAGGQRDTSLYNHAFKYASREHATKFNTWWQKCIWTGSQWLRRQMRLPAMFSNNYDKVKFLRKVSYLFKRAAYSTFLRAFFIQIYSNEGWALQINRYDLKPQGVILQTNPFSPIGKLCIYFLEQHIGAILESWLKSFMLAHSQLVMSSKSVLRCLNDL